MKKVISLVVLVSIILVASTVLGASAKVNVSGQTAIEEGTKTVTMTVSLGAFDDVAEGETLGFQATLEYNNNIFESVTVQGLNGWDVSYEDSSKVVTGLTKSSKANTQIATFTFTVKDGVTAGSTDNILLNNFLLSNDGTLNQEENYSLKVSIVEKPTIEEAGTPEPENEVGGNNTVNTGNTTENKVTGNNVAGSTKNNTVYNTIKDNTVKGSNKLPAAGLTNTIIISAVVVLIVGVGFMIRSKTIKLK